MKGFRELKYGKRHTYCFARDVLLLSEKDYGQVTLKVVEVNRMLASFIQKLNAER